MLATVATVTVGTGTTGRFDVAFRFGLKGPHGQPHLAGLLVNLKQLDIDFLSNCKDILYVLSLVPGNFRNVEKAFLAGKDLDKGTEFEDGNDLSMIGLADLGNCTDALDPIVSLLHGLCIVGSDIHDTLSVNFVDIDDGTGLGLDLLDGLTTLSDDCSDEFLGNLE